MKPLICKMLKGLFVTGWLCTNQIEAATCSPTTAAALQTCLNNLGSGDVVNIAAGTYASSGFTIDGKSFATDSVTIQPAGYTGTFGSGAEVYIYGAEFKDSASPTAGFTACTGSPGTCSCGGTLTAGTPAGTPCNHIWYVDGGSGNISLALGAIRPDRTPTYRVSNLGELTSQYRSYSTGDRNVVSTNARLYVVWGATDPTNSRETGAYVIANGGGGGNGFRIRTSGGITIQGLRVRHGRRSGFQIAGDTPTCTNPPPAACPDRNTNNCIISRTAVPAGKIKILNNQIAYYNDKAGGGSDRPIATQSNNVLIQGNEIFCSGSEFIHTQANGVTASPVATDIDIVGNYLHDGGEAASCLAVMGASQEGTATGMILGDSSDCGPGGIGAGNYTGSTVIGNIITRIQSNVGTKIAKGISFENNSNGWVVSDNIITEIQGVAMKFGASSGSPFSGDVRTATNSVSNNDVYNNIIARNGANIGQGNGAGIWIEANEQSQAASNNKIYNNTLAEQISGSTAGLMISTCGGAGCTGNLIFNNIFHKNGAVNELVRVEPTSNTNKVQNNLFYSTSGNPVRFGTTDYSTCPLFNAALVSGILVGGGNICEDPGFYDMTNLLYYPLGNTGGGVITSGNFLTNSRFGGPAIDSGTVNNVSSTKTAGIVNTLAKTLGFGIYTDTIGMTGSTWDMGAVEAIVSHNLADWTIASHCAGGVGVVESDGCGEVKFTNDHSSDTCSKISIGYSLTSSQNYLIAFRMNDSGEAGGGSGCSGATLPNWYMVGMDPLEPALYRGTWGGGTGRLTGPTARDNTIQGSLTSGLTLQVPNGSTCLLDTEFYFTYPVIIPIP